MFSHFIDVYFSFLTSDIFVYIMACALPVSCLSLSMALLRGGVSE